MQFAAHIVMSEATESNRISNRVRTFVILVEATSLWTPTRRQTGSAESISMGRLASPPSFRSPATNGGADGSMQASRPFAPARLWPASAAAPKARRAPRWLSRSWTCISWTKATS